MKTPLKLSQQPLDISRTSARAPRNAYRRNKCAYTFRTFPAPGRGENKMIFLLTCGRGRVLRGAEHEGGPRVFLLDDGLCCAIVNVEYCRCALEPHFAVAKRLGQNGGLQ